MLKTEVFNNTSTVHPNGYLLKNQRGEALAPPLKPFFQVLKR
jgi:hypothetical protein